MLDFLFWGKEMQKGTGGISQEDAIYRIYIKTNECIPIFQAMGDAERLLILLKLFYAGKKGKNVTELSGNTHLSRSAVSHHLKVLKTAKIIDSYKVGTQVYYFLKIERIANLEGLLKDLQEHLKIININTDEANDKAVEQIIEKSKEGGGVT